MGTDGIFGNKCLKYREQMSSINYPLERKKMFILAK